MDFAIPGVGALVGGGELWGVGGPVGEGPVGEPCGWGPEGWEPKPPKGGGAPKGGGPEGWGARRVGGQNFALFSLSRHNFHFFFSLSGCLLVSFFLSLGVFSWNFGGVLVGRDLKCACFRLQVDVNMKNKKKKTKTRNSLGQLGRRRFGNDSSAPPRNC